MKNPVLYRKRLIPNELIHLKDDVILYCDDSVIITKWKALRPKIDLHHGYSCYFLKEGYKVSKFYREDGSLLYWYCDIVDCAWNEAHNEMTSTDLLADVEIMPDGFVKVIDLDELSEAFEKELIDAGQLKKALVQLNALLTKIYSGKFGELIERLEKMEERN